MNWVDTGPVFFVAVAILILPGLVVGFSLRVRGVTLLALAPAFTISMIAIAAMVGHLLDFRWGLLPLLLTSVAVSAIVLVLRRWSARRWPAPDAAPYGIRTWIATFGVLAFALLTIGLRFSAAFGAPDRISQTFDNIYHLNAVRWILDTGIVSPFKIGGLSYQYDDRLTFYPDMWHAFVALVVESTGVTIPVAANVSNIVIAGLILPLGAIALVRQVAGARVMAAVAAGILSVAFAAFPYLGVEWGVLYPNFLSICLLPAAISVVAMTAGVGRDRELTPPTRWIALAGVLPGLALAHPSSFLALIAFSAPIGVAVLARRARTLRRQNASIARYIGEGAIAAVVLVSAVLVLLVARPTAEVAYFGPSESLRKAVFSALTNSTVERPVDIVLTVLVLLGLWALLRRRRQWWAIASWAIAVGLYIISAGLPISYFRYGFTGIWYNDPFRLAALIPIVALPIAASGLIWLTDAIQSVLARARTTNNGGTRRPAPAIAGVSVAVLIAVCTQAGTPVRVATAAIAPEYVFDETSDLLSPDELALLDRVASEIPAGDTVVGSPWTGTSLVYALEDRRALLPHIYGDRSAETDLLTNSLRDAGTNPAVCEAIDDLDAYWVLDFGGPQMLDRQVVFPGIENLDESSAVELVDREGLASLYRVTSCD